MVQLLQRSTIEDEQQEENCLGQETQGLDIRQWKSVLWSDESKLAIFGSNRRVFVRRREGERMVSACVVPPVKHGKGGVMVGGGALLGSLLVIYSEFKAHLTSMATTAFCSSGYFEESKL